MFKKTIKNCWFWLLAVLITGCQTAPTIKLPSAATSSIKTVRIVAVEAPPLEVLPDLLETRMPNYAHEYNMVLPSTAVEAVYRSPGDILITGKVGHGDSMEIVDLSAKGDASAQTNDWTPALELAAAAETQLNAAQIKTELDRQVVRLPIAARERTAYIGNWRNAVDRWYEQNAAASVEGSKAADAVLEVGIGRYRIFEGQTSLQVFLKLTDPRSGQVLAKTSKTTRVIGDTAIPALLYPQGEGFKSLVRESGAQLMTESMQDIGLIPTHLLKLSEAEPETNAVR